METKRQRKRIDYARMSRSGLAAATCEREDGYLPCSSCDKRILSVYGFSLHIGACTKVPHKCLVCISSENEGQEKNALKTEIETDASSVDDSPKHVSPSKKASNEESDGKKDVDQLYASAVELDQHMAEAHKDSFAFECWICELRFRGLTILQKHVLKEHKVHVKTTYEEPVRLFNCTSCAQEFQSAKELADHFRKNKACGGELYLEQCVELDPDVEDDLLFRLRNNHQMEQEFLSRFPHARIGTYLMIEHTEGSEESVDPTSPNRRFTPSIEMRPDSPPKKRGPKPRKTDPSLSQILPKRKRGRPRSTPLGPMHHRIEAAMKRLKQRQKSGMLSKEDQEEDEEEEADEDKMEEEKETEEDEETALRFNLDNVIDSVVTDSASKPSNGFGSSKLKTMKKPSPVKRGEIAAAAAVVNKSVKRGRGRPPKRMRVSTVTDDQVAIITSPKRRRLSPNTSGFVDSDDENDEGSPTPYSPIKGRSLGLEPEGASDDEDEEVGFGPMHPSTGGPSCDLDEDDEDARAAPAVELNVCRACGLALDTFSEYTRHMQEVHNLALQSPPHKSPSKAPSEALDSQRKQVRPLTTGRPGPGRPRKEPIATPPDKENDSPPKTVTCGTCQQTFGSHELLRHHVRWVHTEPFRAESKSGRGRGRGRRPKHESNPGDRSSFVMQPWVTAYVANTPRSSPPPLLCPLCPDRRPFNSSEEREAHLANDHDGERAFGCQCCGETFSLFYELQLHTRQEHDGGETPPLVEDPARAKLAYKCVVCKVGFHLETVLQRHYDAMHTLDEGEQYHCPVCYFTYSGCRTRDDHVLKKHPEARAFKCPVCEARFASFEVFRAHEKRAHISQKTRMRGPGGIPEPSSLLGLEKPKKAPRRKLAAAMRGALGEKGNSETAEQLAQKRRESRVYKEGTLLCEKCGEDCANEEELDIHTKEHVRKEKRFGCTQCGRVFSGALARSFLVDHIKLEHMHQSPYACDDCGQRFLYKVQVDRHRTVDRDSGVASCRRAEDLPLSLPRLVFGCSRCAKIFAGEGAQSRYSEHQLECAGSVQTAGSSGRQVPTPVRPEPKARKSTKRATQRSQPQPPPLTDSPMAMKGDIDIASSPEESNSLTAPDPVIPSTQEAQSTVIVLPGSGGDASGDVVEGSATLDGVEGVGGEQVVVLSEDILSNVRAATESGAGAGGSVVLIQAEDGTLIVASEEQLAELQMSGAETETAHLVHSEEIAAVGEDVTGRTVRQMLQEKRLREAGFIPAEEAMPESG